jgi:hypothetical protein
MALRPGLPGARELWLLWGGVLAGPVAWLLELETSYAVTGWVCRSGHHWVLHAATAVALAIALGGAAAATGARRTFGRRSAEEPRTVGERRSFLVVSGVGLSLMFALVIAATAVPKLVLSPCML